jgi:hypothetical protein
MSVTRILQASMAALLLLAVAPAAAQTAPATQPGTATTQPGPCGPGYGNGIMGFLTTEQRLMHFAEVQKATADMSFNDARAYRQSLRSKVMAMSAAERQKFAADLSAKWSALTAAQQQKVRDDFAAYRGGHMGMGRGMGQGQGMGRGMGMGRGGCWW